MLVKLEGSDKGSMKDTPWNKFTNGEKCLRSVDDGDAVLSDGDDYVSGWASQWVRKWIG